MQELLFGPSSTSSSQPSTAGRAPMQKPQPVRPSSTSAFSAYVPARGLGTTSPSKNQNNYDSSPDSPPRSFSSSYSKPSYSYSSSPSKTTRDFQSLNRQSPPKISGTLTRPTALSLMTNSDYNPGKVGFSICLHFQIPGGESGIWSGKARKPSSFSGAGKLERTLPFSFSPTRFSKK